MQEQLKRCHLKQFTGENNLLHILFFESKIVTSKHYRRCQRLNIYTKGGDKGTTSLVHTKNVSKSDDRIQLVGTI